MASKALRNKTRQASKLGIEAWALNDRSSYSDQEHSSLTRGQDGASVAERHLSETPDDAENGRSPEALRESERKYRALFEAEADAIFLIDREDGRILDANGAASQIYGYSHDELLTMRNTDVSAEPEQTRRATSADLHHIPTRYHCKKDGTVFPVEITDTALDLGGRSVHIVAIRDITERHRAEEALRSSEEKYRELVQSTNCVILRMTPTGAVTFFNEYAQRFFGFSEEEILGQNIIGTIVPPTEDTGRDLADLMRDLGQNPDRYASNENENVKRSGERVWVAWANKAVRDQSGKITEILCVGHDISERKRAEQALQEANEAEHRRTEEAEQRRKVAEALRGILAVLNSSRPHQEALDYIVAEACRLLGTDTGAIYRLEAEQKLTMQASCGLPAGYVATLPAASSGYLARAMQGRKPVVVSDLASIAAGDNSPKNGPLRAYLSHLGSTYAALLAVPLIVKDEVYGGIALYYREPRQFSAEEVDLAVSFADEAALAIENARLRVQAEQAAVTAERSRLARDLHDAVTQTLFAASLIAEVLPRLWDRNHDEGHRRLEELRQLTRGALAEMRTLLLELRPTALTEAALPSLLRQLAEATTGRARIPVSLVVEGEPELPPDVQVGLYRIAQEALNNVAKHSGASQASVFLACQDGRVDLRISDNGRGFDVGAVPADHLGVGIMRERAESIGAKLSITSRPGKGTEVSVVWQSCVR